MTDLQAILLLVFIISTAINIGYWVFLFSRLASYQPTAANHQPPTTNPELRTPNSELSNVQHPTSNSQPTVSVVICARNEAENLQKNLRRFLNQTYRSFELILVDDNSTDGTASILEQFQRSNPYFRIKIISNRIKKHLGKKDALEKGIQAAEGEWILLTDADCYPQTDEWIEKMATTAAASGKEIVLGFSPYETRPGFLNRFIRFEAVYTAVQYLSFALAGMPYMGVGRNLLYKKMLFERAGGFKSHHDLASGDDDLFVNQVATATNTTICIDEKSFVFSEPKLTWKAWFQQKSRHLTTGIRYRRKHLILLGGLSASHFFHYASGISLASIKFSTIFVFIVFVLRVSLLMIFYEPILRNLRQKSLWKWIPLLDFAFVFFYLIFSPQIITGKNAKWK